uniref:Retrovirus-related Pol polyprotein from transposon TNT 1-94 n=1 Tax=Tanacetum cinerariifolium TaxID=118510 RepID=A0A6L2NQ07_TANCI|nr:hypothetical protein [Tanacetum cinerariifolium]
MNNKSHTLNLEIFKDMLQICPKLLDSKAYKEYYTVVSGAEPPKANTKYKKKPDEPVTPFKSKSAPAAKGTRLKTPARVALTKAKQIKLATKRSKKDFHMAHASGSCDGVDIQSKVPDEQQQKVTGTNEGASVRPEVLDVPKYTSEKSDNDGDELTHPNLSTYKADDKEEEEEKADDDEVSSDQSVYTPPDHQLTDEEGNQKGNDEFKKGEEEQDEEEELYRDLNINLQRTVQQQSSSVSSDLVSKFINPSPDIGIDLILNPNIHSQTLDSVPVFVAAETPSSDTTIPQPPILNIQPLQQTSNSTTTTTIPTMTFPDIPNFASLFQFDQRVSALETEMSEFKQTSQFTYVVSLIPSIVDNYLTFKMKEVVGVAVQLQTHKLREEAQVENQEFLNQIEKYVTESLEAEVLVRSTNQPQTSYAVADSFLEFELKKILIDKMEENKSINRSDIQKNLYNTLVESYNSNKYIITSYGDVVTLKRGRDDQDKDEDPSTGLNRGSKRRRSGKEAESSKQPTHKESKSTSSLKGATRSQPKSSGKSTHAEEHDVDVRQWNPSSSPTTDRKWHKTKTVDNRPPQPWITQMGQAAGTQSSFNEFLATPIDFSAFIMNRLKINNLTQEDYFINNDLEYLKGGSSSQKYTTSITKMKVADYGQVKWIKDKWFGYSHLEEIIVRRRDDKLYKFREGDFKRLRRQDIEDILLLLIQDKFSNLNLEERYALNVALRMFTRRIIIQERVEDLKLGIKSYQKKINLKKPDPYRSDLQRITPYIAYPDIQGIIYEDEMNINRLMRTDELHKFNDGTLNHVRTALNDISTGIEMYYLPKQKWSKKTRKEPV